MLNQATKQEMLKVTKSKDKIVDPVFPDIVSWPSTEEMVLIQESKLAS